MTTQLLREKLELINIFNEKIKTYKINKHLEKKHMYADFIHGSDELKFVNKLKSKMFKNDNYEKYNYDNLFNRKNRQYKITRYFEILNKNISRIIYEYIIYILQIIIPCFLALIIMYPLILTGIYFIVPIFNLLDSVNGLYIIIRDFWSFVFLIGWIILSFNYFSDYTKNYDTVKINKYYNILDPVLMSKYCTIEEQLY